MGAVRSGTRQDLVGRGDETRRGQRATTSSARRHAEIAELGRGCLDVTVRYHLRTSWRTLRERPAGRYGKEPDER